MVRLIVAQANVNEFSDNFYARIAFGLFVFYLLFILHLYIFRAIFNIPSFLKYQKAQVKLLEHIAKKNGVDDATLNGIISETAGWNDAPQNPPTNAASGIQG